MQLSEYVVVLRKYWVLVVLAAILGLAAGAGVSLLMTPKYESHTQMYVSVRSDSAGPGELVQGATYTQQIINSYIAVIQTGLVLDPVVEQFQLDMSAAELSEHVTASSPGDSALIDITVTSPNAEQSAALANAVAASFQQVVVTQLEPGVTPGPGPVNITTTQQALVPDTPVSPQVPINLVFGLIVGFLLGYAIALLRTLLDRRLHSAQEIEQLTDLPLLGAIVDGPKAGHDHLVVNSNPHSPRAESFRALRTNLQFLNTGATGNVFVLSSPNPGEGKSTTSLNLALALAQAGSRVVVVEGDLRRPIFDQYLGIEGGAGLTDVLIGRAELDDVLQLWGVDMLSVLPAGRVPPNPSELLGSAEMKQVVDALSADFDYVLIDAPPVLAVTDAVVLGRDAAGLIMAVATGSTTRNALTDALKTLETSGVKVLGLVATMVPATGPNSYGYGAYGYGGTGTHRESTDPAPLPKRGRESHRAGSQP